MFFAPPTPSLFLCFKHRELKFGMQLEWVKSTIKSNVELDMTNCDVSMCHIQILSKTVAYSYS